MGSTNRIMKKAEEGIYAPLCALCERSMTLTIYKLPEIVVLRFRLCRQPLESGPPHSCQSKMQNNQSKPNLAAWLTQTIDNHDKQTMYFVAYAADGFNPPLTQYYAAERARHARDARERGVKWDESEEEDGEEEIPSPVLLKEAEEALKIATEAAKRGDIPEETLEIYQQDVEELQNEVQKEKLSESTPEKDRPTGPRRWWRPEDKESASFWGKLEDNWKNGLTVNTFEKSSELEIFWKELLRLMLEYTHQRSDWETYCGELKWFVHDIFPDIKAEVYDPPRPQVTKPSDNQGLFNNFLAFVQTQSDYGGEETGEEKWTPSAASADSYLSQLSGTRPSALDSVAAPPTSLAVTHASNAETGNETVVTVASRNPSAEASEGTKASHEHDSKKPENDFFSTASRRETSPARHSNRYDKN